MKDFIKVMKALSDTNRVRILKMLQQRSLCVCEMQSLLGIAQSTVSSHLRILEDAGLVRFRKEGLWVNYLLADGESSPYAAAMLGKLDHWLTDEPEIMLLHERLPTVSREEICKRESEAG